MIIYKYPNHGGIPSSNYFSTLYCILTCPHRAEACIWNISPIYPMFNNLDELHYICKCNIPSEPGACAGGAGRWGAGAGAGRLLQPRHRPRPRRHPRQVNLGRAMWVQLSGDFTRCPSVGIFLMILDIWDLSPTTRIVQEIFWVVNAAFLSICQVSLWKWICIWQHYVSCLEIILSVWNVPGRVPRLTFSK